jgi:hypothetical protein
MLSLLVVIWYSEASQNESSSSDESSSGEESNKTFNAELPSESEIRQKVENGQNPYLDFIREAGIRAQLLLKKNPNFYVETHHIIPRFEGGSNDPSNLVVLTYNDHAIAHYIRWIVYAKKQDKLAYEFMIGQSVDIRKERASLGGSIGGPIAQQQHKERGVGWFDSKGQSERGKKGAAVNRAQGTGAFDSRNLEKANQVLRENSELFAEQKAKNLEQGRKTQKAKGIGIGDPIQQRLKSLKRFNYIELNGIQYSLDTEQRTYVCETTLEYYLRYAPKKKST